MDKKLAEIKEFFGQKWPANLMQTVSIIGGSFFLGKFDRPDKERYWDIRKEFLHEQSMGMITWVHERIEALTAARLGSVLKKQKNDRS